MRILAVLLLGLAAISGCNRSTAKNGLQNVSQWLTIDEVKRLHDSDYQKYLEYERDHMSLQHVTDEELKSYTPEEQARFRKYGWPRDFHP